MADDWVAGCYSLRGALRAGCEVSLPLHVWKHASIHESERERDSYRTRSYSADSVLYPSVEDEFLFGSDEENPFDVQGCDFDKP